MNVPQRISTMSSDTESCELERWSTLQGELLQQIVYRKRDIAKGKLRKRMETYSIHEYLKEAKRIDKDHKNRLERIKKWQILEKEKPVMSRNINGDTENRMKKNVVTEEKKLNTGTQNKSIGKNLVCRGSDKKQAVKSRKTGQQTQKKQRAQKQHFKAATLSKNKSSSTSTKGFLITKLSSSTTVIKKISLPKQSLSKTHSIPPRPSTSQIEISSATSPAPFESLNTSEIKPGTSKTMMNPSSDTFPEESLESPKLLCQSSRPIRQYGPSSKHYNKSAKPAKYELIENNILSTNSSATSTEKMEICHPEIISPETLPPLLSKPSFHNDWSEPEVYYTPKL